MENSLFPWKTKLVKAHKPVTARPSTLSCHSTSQVSWRLPLSCSYLKGSAQNPLLLYSHVTQFSFPSWPIGLPTPCFPSLERSPFPWPPLVPVWCSAPPQFLLFSLEPVPMLCCSLPIFNPDLSMLLVFVPGALGHAGIILPCRTLYFLAPHELLKAPGVCDLPLWMSLWPPKPLPPHWRCFQKVGTSSSLTTIETLCGGSSQSFGGWAKTERRQLLLPSILLSVPENKTLSDAE